MPNGNSHRGRFARLRHGYTRDENNNIVKKVDLPPKPAKEKRIIEPTPAFGIRIPAHGWHCRPYQTSAWDYMTENVTGAGKRACLEWHRRAGKDLFSINLIMHMMTKRQGMYWHVFPMLNQGRKAIWQGYTAGGRRMLDYIPHEIRADINNSEMRIDTKTGCTYQLVGGDDPDKLVGSGPIGVVFSEYAITDPSMWKFISPMLNENGGWALFISTPRRDNHWATLCDFAKGDPTWFYEKLTVDDTYFLDPNGKRQRVINEAQIEEERRQGFDEDHIKQEYWCDRTAAIQGTYYSHLMKQAEEQGRIKDLPVDPYADVHTAWDFGYGDAMVVIAFQLMRTGDIHIVDCFHDTGEGIAYYADILKRKPYARQLRQHFAPWDVLQGSAQTGETMLVAGRKAGITFRVGQRHRVEDGIQAVRSAFPRLYFDRKNCRDLIKALHTYKKKGAEDVNSFGSIPVHDKSSHFADCLRYLCFAQPRRDYRQRQTSSEPANLLTL